MSTPSITSQPVFKPALTRELCMEELGAAKLALYDSLQKNGEIFQTIQDDNKFWDSFSLFLEESLGWPDYRSHN